VSVSVDFYTDFKDAFISEVLPVNGFDYDCSLFYKFMRIGSHEIRVRLNPCRLFQRNAFEHLKRMQEHLLKYKEVNDVIIIMDNEEATYTDIFVIIIFHSSNSVKVICDKLSNFKENHVCVNAITLEEAEKEYNKNK
jgi:hypothetical protein